MKLNEAYPDLAPLLKGARFKRFCDTLHALALCRYMSFDQLNSINFQVCTEPKLKELVRLGYLAIKSDNVYVIGDLGKQLLSERGYDLSVLQKELDAETAVHELKITDVILREMKTEDFFIVIYPRFDSVRPDCCIIRKRGNQAKLQMVEVEEEKGNWQEYLLKKKLGYEQLARDENLYHRWWRYWAKALGFKLCTIEDFGFEVVIYGGSDYGWKGFETH